MSVVLEFSGRLHQATASNAEHISEFSAPIESEREREIVCATFQSFYLAATIIVCALVWNAFE